MRVGATRAAMVMRNFIVGFVVWVPATCEAFKDLSFFPGWGTMPVAECDECWILCDGVICLICGGCDRA